MKRYDEIGGEFSLTISRLEDNDVGNYTCVVTNEYGSDKGVIEVKGKILILFLKQPQNIIIL